MEQNQDNQSLKSDSLDEQELLDYDHYSKNNQFDQDLKTQIQDHKKKARQDKFTKIINKFKFNETILHKYSLNLGRFSHNGFIYFKGYFSNQFTQYLLSMTKDILNRNHIRQEIISGNIIQYQFDPFDQQLKRKNAEQKLYELFMHEISHLGSIIYRTTKKKIRAYNFTYMYTPNSRKQMAQIVHSDRFDDSEKICLMALNKVETTLIYDTKLTKKKLKGNNFEQDNSKNEFGRIVDQITRESFKEKFKALQQSEQWFDRYLTKYVDDVQTPDELPKYLYPGDLLILRADILHRGPKTYLKQGREMLFFNISPVGTKRGSNNLQINGGLYSDMCYGTQHPDFIKFLQNWPNHEIHKFYDYEKLKK